MKKIQLGGHKKGAPIRGYALVDDADYEWLNQWEWSWNQGYALRRTGSSKFKAEKSVHMHRAIMNPPKNKEVDHKDRNRSNNQRKNLRICTSQQNRGNTSARKNSKSGILGVWWDKAQKRWHTKIGFRNKIYWLGSFVKKKDAVKARKDAEKKYLNNFAPKI